MCIVMDMVQGFELGWGVFIIIIKGYILFLLNWFGCWVHNESIDNNRSKFWQFISFTKC